jgi:hypothetical protein
MMPLRRLYTLMLMVGLVIAGCLPAPHGVPLAESPVARPTMVQVNLQIELPRKVQTLPATWDEIMLSIAASGSAPVSQTASTSASTVAMTFQVPTGPATISCELHNVGAIVARGTTTANLVAGNNPVHLVLSALTPFVTSLTPTMAAPGSPLTLEGNFPGGANSTVTFPGGKTVQANPLGPNRIQVTVPLGETSGPLQVTSSGSAPLTPPVRLVSFGIGLQPFFATYDQINGARQTPTLPTALRYMASVVIGPYLYVIGGGNNGIVQNTIQRATINADGTLGAFTPMPTTLNTARGAHTATVIGNFLYVIGGTDGTNQLASVERAPILPGGSLGSFTTLTAAALNTAREGHAVAVVGNRLYVVGGFKNPLPIGSIERANINADGSIGPFTLLSDVSLNMPRAGLTCAVTGGYLYAIAGNGLLPLASLERAGINPDGTLQPFSTVSSLLNARYSHSSVVIGNTLYVIGGYRDLAFSQALASIEQATIAPDGTVGAFSSAGTLTIPRAAHLSVPIGNYLYVIGGHDGTNYLNTLERASLNGSGALGALGAPPFPNFITQRSEHATVILGDRLYALGGYAGQGDPRLDSVESAKVSPDGVLGQFDLSAAGGVRQSDKLSTAVIGNYVYLIGGRRMGSLGVLEPLDFVRQASINSDGSLGSFRSLAPQGIKLNQARYGHATVVLGNYLYVIGGGDTGVFSFFHALNSTERAPINPDGTLGNFQPVPGVNLVQEAIDPTCVVLGNRLYVIGGLGGSELNNSGSYLDYVQVAPLNADGTLGSFTTDRSFHLVASRTGHASALVGNKLYVLGGHDRQTYQAKTGFQNAEVATVNADGTLTPFATVPGLGVPGVPYARNGVQLGNFFYLLGSEVTGNAIIDQLPLQ